MPSDHCSVLKLYTCKFSDMCSRYFWLWRVKTLIEEVHHWEGCEETNCFRKEIKYLES